jgi:pre-rRNA-processing protein TSR4
MLVLLLQLNADLPQQFPGHDRRLYILSCRRKACRRKDGSIRVLRGVRISPDAAAAAEAPKPEVTTKPEPKPVVLGQGKVVSNTMFGDTLFGAKPAAGALGGNPFASPSSAGPANPFSTPSPAANPFATASSSLAAKPAQTPPAPTPAADLPKTFAAALTLNAAPASAPAPAPFEPWPPASSLPPPYPLLYLSDADYETLDKEAPAPPQAHQLLPLDTEPSSSGGGREDKDVYESSLDSTFQKFADRLAQNPEQVIRYEFGGQPLLYSKTDAVGRLLGGARPRLPGCGNCGAARVCEVQMTPHAIAELECEEEGVEEGMEWGTVVVGVCERDCQVRGVGVGEVGYLEEWAGVQWEEVRS